MNVNFKGYLHFNNKKLSMKIDKKICKNSLFKSVKISSVSYIFSYTEGFELGFDHWGTICPLS